MTDIDRILDRNGIATETDQWQGGLVDKLKWLNRALGMSALRHAGERGMGESDASGWTGGKRTKLERAYLRATAVVRWATKGPNSKQFPAASIARHWKIFFLLGVTVMLPMSSARGQTESDRELLFRMLYTACQPIALVVESLPDGAADIGLSKQAVVNAGESRLRSARIYDQSAQAYLYININVVGGAHSIDLRLNKVLFDPLTQSQIAAVTWTLGGTGTHGRNAQYILGGLSEYLDSFLVDFLRVNESACDGPV